MPQIASLTTVRDSDDGSLEFGNRLFAMAMASLCDVALVSPIFSVHQEKSISKVKIDYDYDRL